MQYTDQFEIWLNDLEDVDVQEIQFLQQAIADGESNHTADISFKGNVMYVKSHVNPLWGLIIWSDLARRSILKRMDNEFGGEFGWVGGQAAFEYAMSKED